MGAKDFVKGILTEKENRRYDRLLQTGKLTYEEWVRDLEKEDVRRLSASGKSPAEGLADLVVIKGAEGVFSENLFLYAEDYMREHPEVLILYGDEDVREEGCPGEAGIRKLPWFKPDWSPDLLEGSFYFGSVVILRKDLFLRMTEGQEPVWLREAGEQRGIFREKTEIRKGKPEVKELSGAEAFAAYESWIRGAVRLAGGYEKGSGVIGHIPRILFHCAALREREKFWGGAAGKSGTDKEKLRISDRISVIIPSKDQPDILKTCLEGCVLAAALPEGGSVPFEIIVVDNGSSGENRKKTEKLLEEMNSRCAGTAYLYRPQEFNFSRMCNEGAKRAEGKLLLFLNDDVELCSRGCLRKMALSAGRKGTGAVGLKLYYPDSCRIQHAGITNLPMGPVHKLQFLNDDKAYYYGANRGIRNVLAVTAACLMVEREKYLEAGGFPEELRVAFNDVDFCFRLYELGYHNVCVNEEYAYHHESLSRGADETPEKLERLLRERDKLYKRHPALEGKDPYYSPFLNREGLDTAIRPAYLTAGNRRQKVPERPGTLCLGGYRRDECLLVRVEDCRKGRIAGYGVVLGDNNACYDRMLLLEKVPENGGERPGEVRMPGGKSDDIKVYKINLRGQYRPDLEENMPDQVRVGLCGFDVEIEDTVLPEGRYRLGMAARSRVSGGRLVNWSSRFMEV